MDLTKLVAAEAEGARAAASHLADDAVGRALAGTADRLLAQADAVLSANEQDYARARDHLDEGLLDRLRLDERRLSSVADQVRAMVDAAPLERDGGTWTLPSGIDVTERRIPVGVIGTNFEARPNVALDVAAQLLKSLNAGVLRTGGAALGTVTAMVDDVLRPALEDEGIPGAAIGLVRSPDREGARVLVSQPRLIPLVILRGSGETTAALARLAAEHGVRTMAHAEGGGVLYVHGSADGTKARELTLRSLDRLGVCNRLNLLLVDREAQAILPDLVEAIRGLELEVRGTDRARAATENGIEPLDVRIGHEWANDSDRVATVTVDLVDDLEEAASIANDETSGLAAGVVAEDGEAAEAFLDRYRGTAAFWHASTRLTDGFALTGAPETGINVDTTPGPRGPVTYRDLWLRQYRVVGNGTQ